MHLLIKAPKSNTDEFCQHVNREISRRTNWLVRRMGSLWARRYVDQEVVTEDDLIEAFLYVNTNVTHHGLVSHPSQWTGLHSAEHAVTETDRKFSFRHYSTPDKIVTVHKLKLSPLPQFKDLSSKARKKKISALIEERVQRLYEEKSGKFLGMRAVLAQDPYSKPENTKSAPRAPFYSKSIEVILEKRKEVRARRKVYDEASFRYRVGLGDYQFPEFSYYPPLHILPRLVPFTPIISLLSA